MRTFALPLLGPLLSFALAGGDAYAGAGAVRVAIEPGVATLSPPVESKSWGVLGGAALAVNLSDQLWAQLHVDRKEFAARKPQLAATAIDASLGYDIDVLGVRPSLGLGASYVVITDSKSVQQTAIVPILSLGVDVVCYGWLLLGAVVRYYPLFGSDLLSSPAYATFHGRIGVALGLSE